MRNEGLLPGRTSFCRGRVGGGEREGLTVCNLQRMIVIGLKVLKSQRFDWYFTWI
jgi:hypothetical protein